MKYHNQHIYKFKEVLGDMKEPKITIYFICKCGEEKLFVRRGTDTNVIIPSLRDQSYI